MFFQILVLLFLIPAVLVCAYYVFLAVTAFCARRTGPESKSEKTSFAIVIPAHNEEKVIADTLRSCAGLQYPKDKYRVYVIADNCSDGTAEVARKYGAECLVRRDESRSGKGFALEWGISQILKEKPDAVVVLDADCRLDTNALRVFSGYLEEGERVLQASDIAANPDQSPTSYAVAVGNLIENDLFYYPKSRLGLAVFLRGTGMVFTRKVLEEIPWNAMSNAEDVEYTLHLLRKGIRVGFVKDIHVSSDFPETADKLRVQRTRWASGNIRLGKKNALRLIIEGLAGGNWALVDAGWTLMVLSRPLVLLELTTTVILSGLCLWITPGPFSSGLFAISGGLILIYIFYFFLGVILLGISARRMGLLLGTPAVILRLIGISLSGLFGMGKDDWVKTPR